MMELILSPETTILTRATRGRNPEDDIQHSHRHENIKILHSINRLGSVAEMYVFPVRYEQDFYIQEDGILHSHRRENLHSYIALTALPL
jgi:hypothetical protein